MSRSGTPDGCEAIRLSLGGFVLNALTPHEARDVRVHLAMCPACRREYEELFAVAPLLGMVARADAEAALVGPGPQPPTEPRRPRSHATGSRRARRRGPRAILLLSSAVALAVVVGTAVAGWPAGGGGHTATARVVSATDRVTGVGASVTSEPASWGSKLTLALHHAPPGTSCSLVAVGWQGQREVAARWSAKYGGDLTIPGAVAMSPPDIARFDVESSDGRRLVSVPE
jgi:hypothetical protein